jgi:hypothetical protein
VTHHEIKRDDGLILILLIFPEGKGENYILSGDDETLHCIFHNVVYQKRR